MTPRRGRQRSWSEIIDSRLGPGTMATMGSTAGTGKASKKEGRTACRVIRLRFPRSRGQAAALRGSRAGRGVGPRSAAGARATSIRE